MVESTILNEKLIKVLCEKHYNLHIDTVRKINRGSASIYKLLTTKNKLYILKEFQRGYTKAEVEKEFKIIQHLEKTKIPVPRYVITQDNKFYFHYDSKIFIVQEFIEGLVVDKHWGTSEMLKESAFYLADIIKSLKTFDLDDLPTTKKLIDENQIEKTNKKYNTIIKKYSHLKDSELNRKKTLFEKTISLDSIIKEFDYLTYEHSHGDYSVMQFIYDEDYNILSIIDYLMSKKLPICWEIIRSYSYLDKECISGKIHIKNLVEYVKIFNDNYKLSYYDLKLMPYYYLVQILKSTYGYKEYLEDQNNKSLLEFARFRTVLAEDLYENREKYSKELLKLYSEN